MALFASWSLVEALALQFQESKLSLAHMYDVYTHVHVRGLAQSPPLPVPRLQLWFEYVSGEVEV